MKNESFIFPEEPWQCTTTLNFKGSPMVFYGAGVGVFLKLRQPHQPHNTCSGANFSDLWLPVSNSDLQKQQADFDWLDKACSCVNRQRKPEFEPKKTSFSTRFVAIGNRHPSHIASRHHWPFLKFTRTPAEAKNGNDSGDVFLPRETCI